MTPAECVEDLDVIFRLICVAVICKIFTAAEEISSSDDGAARAGTCQARNNASKILDSYKLRIAPKAILTRGATFVAVRAIWAHADAQQPSKHDANQDCERVHGA